MKNLNKLIFIITIICFSCDDILEEDITNDSVQIINPIEGYINQGNTVAFSWQVLDGVDNYRIQIINDLQIKLVDSLITANQFTYNLNPGSYQWRIKGENFAYQTAYNFPVNFDVQSSEDLSNQNIVLSTPSEDFYTNSTDIILTWDGISSADYYHLDVIKNLGGQQTVLQQSNITDTNFSLNNSLLDEDAEYLWSIKATNSASETSFSERSIFLDTTQPNQPSLVSPLDQENMSSLTVTFNWLNGTDTGNVQSDIFNIIEIASDISFNSIVNISEVDTNSFQYTFSNNGTYYWRVKAFDSASNVSDNSIIRTLIIQ